ncbi:hypothetical protein BDZ85DRAFT_269524 [Elsinoe ampelina]|uniref:Uncharacterized protein n=1 Tax=Elsinoe ampelina TaxID=302913 RepID=A0A6A6G0A7_9PEZI|nr:hypothetical protein BDZ85DRAFT_269524 [Elsinoe ampelina]
MFRRCRYASGLPLSLRSCQEVVSRCGDFSTSPAHWSIVNGSKSWQRTATRSRPQPAPIFNRLKIKKRDEKKELEALQSPRGGHEGPFDDEMIRARLAAWHTEYPSFVRSFKHAVDVSVPSSDVDRNVLFCLESMPDFYNDYKWTNVVQAKFTKRRNAMQTKIEHLHEVGRRLFRSSSQTISRVGLLFMQCCSQEGYLDASLDLGVSSQRDAPKNRPRAMLADNEVAGLAMVHLEKFAERGNVLAATLLAELASRQQHSLRHLVNFWDRAVKLATEQHDTLMQTTIAARFEHLRKPWIQAAELLRKIDPAMSTQYLRVGMQLDDADAYAMYALQHEDDTSGDDIAFLEWLNAATKAAASGSIRSSVALARHYANTSAPDLKEMLDAETPAPPILRRIKANLDLGRLFLTGQLKKFAEKQEAMKEAEIDRVARNYQARLKREENVLTDYHAAVAEFDASCRSPLDRVQMATQWLDLAYGYSNVAAALDLAYLHSRLYLFQEFNMYIDIRHPDAQTDKDILEIVKDYPEQYGTTPKLEDPWDYDKDEPPPMKDAHGFRIVRKGIENPFYSPSKVRDYLNAVAFCKLAIESVKRSDAKSWADKQDLQPDWYRFPDVARYNEEIIEDSWAEARRYADILGVDLVDFRLTGEDRGMMYRHQGVRGEGIAEVDNKVLHLRDEAARLRTRSQQMRRDL